MTSKRAWWLLLFVLAAGGCGPGTIEDLSRPAIGVVVREGGGFCSFVYAVDSGGGVWSAGGCGSDDSGFSRHERTVDAAERAELDAMMDDVLALSDDPECDVVSPSDRSYRFVRTTGDGDEEVRQCGSGIPLVALELAERLEALATTASSTDAGAPADAG